MRMLAVVTCAGALGNLAIPAPTGIPAPEIPAPGFAALAEVDPSIGQEMRYATAHNFTGAVVEGYEEPVCLLARPAAEALRRAQREVLRRGYSLLVYDCYRPQRAVDRFVQWARDGADQGTKAEFYPRVEKDRLVPEGYIAEKSGHSRGSTVDVALTDLGREPLDMGTPFDFFDPLARTDNPRVTGPARAHRNTLKEALGAQGFVNLPEEWWHFTYKPEAFPDTYFDFPVSVAAVRPSGRQYGAGRDLRFVRGVLADRAELARRERVTGDAFP
ncbi:M15 family metallopeptidase [Streptomyces sp. ISL-66]|uniref:M15 family metallopeptidase n=1 Tax=Streptomyces sp. ISL-66 TaxID=2819186 RepID=UPI0035AFE2DF